MVKPGALGNAVKMARIKMGMTQEELAERVDVTPTHLKHMESEHRKPSIEVLFRLADVLNMSLDNLIFEHSNKEQLINDVNALLSECSEKELTIIKEMIHIVKNNR